MDYFFAFIVLSIIIYRGLGYRDKVRALEETNLTYEARIKALSAENLVLRQARTPPGPNPFGPSQAYWQQQNNWQYANAYSPFSNSAPPPPPRQPPLSEWRAEFGFGYGQNVTRDAINSAFRTKALKAHPDKGGNTDDMARLNRLKQQAFAEVPA